AADDPPRCSHHTIGQSLRADHGGMSAPTQHPGFNLLQIVEAEGHPHLTARQINRSLARMPTATAQDVRRPVVEINHDLVIAVTLEDAETALEKACDFEIARAGELSGQNLRVNHAREYEAPQCAPRRVVPDDV